MSEKYPKETFESEWEDDGTMQQNVDDLAEHVVGHRIVSAEKVERKTRWDRAETAFEITLDNGKRVQLGNQWDCCAYTELEAFLLHADKVDHIITGVGTTDGFTRWHIYADMGDVLELTLGWSAGNVGYYAYGFDIAVEEAA